MAHVQQEPVSPGRARAPSSGVPVRLPVSGGASDEPARAPPSSLPVGLSTGIGHLPHCDPGDAVEFVLRHTPASPRRRRSPPGPGGRGWSPRPPPASRASPSTTTAPSTSIRRWSTPRLRSATSTSPATPTAGCGPSSPRWPTATGPIKVSLTGPVTLGVALHAAGLDADLAFAVAGGRGRGAGRRPSSTTCCGGCRRRSSSCSSTSRAMASLTEPGFPIGPTEGVDLVSGAMAVVEHVAVTGLHCCHPADYRLLLGAGPRILSIPVDGGHRAPRRPARRPPRPWRLGRLGRGAHRRPGRAHGRAAVAPAVGGVVRARRPTAATRCCCAPTPSITPVCGLAHHGVTQAEQVMELTGRLASRLQDQAIGVRLAAGA